MSNQVYQIISDRLLQIIQTSGKLPWVKEWKGGKANAPMNGFTKRSYDPFGINFFLLSNAPYSSPYWLTYKQVGEMGGNVRKGEKGWPVVFWKISNYEQTKDNGDTIQKTFPLLRYYTVFNAEQCEGIEIPVVNDIPFNHNPIESAQRIIDEFKNAPEMVIKASTRAYYQPGLDQVTMPLLNQFTTPEAFYSTFFHELGHSTGHQKRLNRKAMSEFNPFGSHGYGEEELTAELTAAFLCAESGISNETLERNSAAYLQGWMKAIKADPSLFVMAANRAGKAAKHILGVAQEQEEKEEIKAVA